MCLVPPPSLPSSTALEPPPFDYLPPLLPSPPPFPLSLSPFLQAGCVPVLIDAATSTPSVLLVRSRWNAAIWLFPKGGVDGGESAKEAAVRETVEEAGVAGEVWGRKLGVWEFVSTRQKQKMWLLRVTDVHDGHSKKWKEVR